MGAELHGKDGFAWYRLAFALQSQEKWNESLDALRKAAEFPEVRGEALLNTACARARLGRTDEALGSL